MRAAEFKAGDRMRKGEITAFLSLVFLLMMSFAGAMIESASIQVLKNYKRADMELAMESIFAEYQKELLEQYDIFALDGSYESGIFAEEKIMRRLTYYGSDGIENKVESFELLTDQSGEAFYKQAVRYMKNKWGMDVFAEEEEKPEVYQNHIKGELDSMLGEAKESLPAENNPIQSVADFEESGLLQIIVPDPEQLSKKVLKREQLASVRELKKGRGHLAIQESEEAKTYRPLFHAYLMEHFSSMVNPGEEKALSYELEYLLGGEVSDQENLEKVCRKILAIRFAMNYGYLLFDETKKAEAEIMALTLCSLLTVPGITEVVNQALLAAWAYGESVLELRTLAAGKKVPIIKNAENWTIQLSGILTLADRETWKESPECEEGISYQDYLKVLMIPEKKEELSMRALDLIESNLHIPADCFVTQLEVKSDCKLRRGIHYKFLTYFGYQ